MATRRALFFSLLWLAAVVLFVGLGVWQVERRTWKLDLIARVDARLHAAPVAAPGPDAWPRINAKHNEYERVVAQGHFLHDKETPVLAVTALGRGYWIMTPLITERGFTVLVNRGFVPSNRKDPATRTAGEVSGTVTVRGLVRMSEPHGAFLHKNIPQVGRWYSRDVAAIAQVQGLDEVAPYFIDADGTPNPGGLPVGGLTVVRFRNSHLVYALTWFGMALLCGLMLAKAWRDR